MACMKRNLCRLAILTACVPKKTPGLSIIWREADEQILAVFVLWTSSTHQDEDGQGLTKERLPVSLPLLCPL